MKKRFNDFDASDADASYDEPYLRPARASRLGCFGRLALTGALLVVALGTVAAFLYWRSVSAPIDAENASTGKLVGWLALRDLSVETPETRERLFDRYVETLGGDNGVVEPEKLELPPQAKKFAQIFFSERAKNEAEEELRFEDDDAVASKRPDAERAPYLRLDYYVATRPVDSTQTSVYVVSDDVRPGPAFVKRWNANRQEAKNGAAKTKKTPAVEKNVRLLAMQWFVAQRKAYDAAPDAEKARRLEKTRDELLGWQQLYKKIRLDATRKSAPRSEMLAEFEETVESWNEFETPEELAKTLWFKDLIVAAVAAQETPLGRFATPKPPRARKIATNETRETNERSPVVETSRDLGRRTLDAARRLLFETPSDADAPTL